MDAVPGLRCRGRKRGDLTVCQILAGGNPRRLDTGEVGNGNGIAKGGD